MGVYGLWKLLEASGKPVPLESLEGKVLAIGKSQDIYIHTHIHTHTHTHTHIYMYIYMYVCNKVYHKNLNIILIIFSL